MVDEKDLTLHGYNLMHKNVIILHGSYVPDCCGAIDIKPGITMTSEELVHYLQTLDKKYEGAFFGSDSDLNQAFVMVSTTLDMADSLKPIAKNLWAYDREHCYPYEDDEYDDDYDDED